MTTTFDWIIQTNKPSLTLTFAERVGEVLFDAFETMIGLPLSADERDPDFTVDRLQLRVKDGGGGWRDPASIVDHAYLNTINMIGPILIGASHQRLGGIAMDLEDLFGAGAFDDSERDIRYETFATSGSEYADEFVAAHQRLAARDEQLLADLQRDGADQLEITALRATSPMLVSLAQLGSYANFEPVTDPETPGTKEKLGKMSRHWWSRVTALRLSQRAKALETDDLRRVAWYGRSSTGGQIFQMPDPRVELSSTEHREAVCTILALDSPAAHDIVGEEIPTNNPRQSHTVDAKGWNLSNASGWKGDNERKVAHDSIEVCAAEGLVSAALHAWRKDGTKRRLARGLPLSQGRRRFESEASRGKLLAGIMPDIITELGDADKLGDADGPGDVWFDIKTISGRYQYVKVSDSVGHAVRKKQADVVQEYRGRARRADGSFFRGDPRAPFQHLLDDISRVKGLVVGMFSEFSQDVDQLIKFVAGKTAERWAALNGLPAEEALQACTWDLKRQWSFTALRANARIRIECAHHVKRGPAPSGVDGSGGSLWSGVPTHARWSNSTRRS